MANGLNHVEWLECARDPYTYSFVGHKINDERSQWYWKGYSAMICDAESRRILAREFTRIHDTLCTIQSRVEALQNDEAIELHDAMQLGILAPMRRMRELLDIPYCWIR